ncbi:MAG: glycosyltransferase, partial [Candidatus Eremiobacteraeota bacterium]|nr:glycosyltransferase [Candidatus Eremiobacteraeota bacterium]
RLRNAALRRAGKRSRPTLPEQTLPAGPFDLFLAIFHFPQQLAQLDALPGWRERARTAVCYIVEAWSRELPRYAKYLHLLDQFDQVFVLNQASIPTLQTFTRAPLTFLPTATDTERFCPLPLDPARVIDVYSYGRRSPAAHAAMLDLSRHEPFYYIYDTLGDASIVDFRAHRDLLANTLKRSRYTIAYPVNANRGARTGGEEALTTRYFEGAASGAIMLGDAPATPEFRECFDWPDAIFDFPFEPDDIRADFAALDADPQRLTAARWTGVAQSLRRHDWLHRWQRVLDAAGLAHTPAMARRAERLDALAWTSEGNAGTGSMDGRRRETPRETLAASPIEASRTAPSVAGSGASRAARVERHATRAVRAPLQDSLFRRGGGRRCPNCAELSPGTAVACVYCGERL